MVEFVDGSIKMQASLPSMHLPILNALSYPERLNTAQTGLMRELRWAEVAGSILRSWTKRVSPASDLALRGGASVVAPTHRVLVGADEEAVAFFLAGKIGLLGIAELIEDCAGTTSSL